jgi:anti-anti-sigma factor
MPGGHYPGMPQVAVAAVLTDTLAVAQIVVVNLDGVHHLASAGLRVLIEAKYHAAEKGSDLQLVCHSPSANRVLDGSGLREHFNFADSVPIALGQ